MFIIRFRVFKSDNTLLLVFQKVRKTCHFGILKFNGGIGGIAFKGVRAFPGSFRHVSLAQEIAKKAPRESGLLPAGPIKVV